MPRPNRMPLNRLEIDHPELRDDGAILRQRIAQLERVDAPRLRRLWQYYRNATTPAAAGTSGRPYREGQEWGLPARITGATSDIEVSRKEVVIENDIAWRVDAMVDFLFGQPLIISSAVKDEARRNRIESLLRETFSRNGGIAFLQKLAVIGAVYGQVDVIVKYVGPSATGSAAAAQAPAQPTCDAQLLGGAHADSSESTAEQDAALASMIRFEIVEPTRALPILCPVDPGAVVAYAQHFRIIRRTPSADSRQGGSWLDALKLALTPNAQRPWMNDGRDVSMLEIVSPTRWQRYEDGKLVSEGENSLGRLPLVHVQNTAVPFEYGGHSDVDPLMPLQDELNTRLSDRAYRITMQSFKMYLARGLEDFTNVPVGPGRMYSTDNENASIDEFGGDSACPSEQGHIDEIREALDKTSGVSPIAAGAIKGRIGRLSSAAALRVTLLALLGRTERKRTTYGPAIAQLCELSLAWLDRAGHFATAPAERRVNIYWPNPIPANETEQIDKAKAKSELGIDPAQVARELGY